MRKQLLSILCLMLLCVAVLCPLGADAAPPLDPNAETSLTLYYQKDGTAFTGLPVAVYRVAEAFSNGTFSLIAPFSSYPVNIHGITVQEQWTHVATTLTAYIAANQVKPDVVVQTDDTGVARFSGLKTGLYLVNEVIAENPDGTYIFNRFMVYLPTPQPDGSCIYDVEAKPKCTGYIPNTQYTVTKLWQDEGNEASRPKNVTVNIYKDGILQESQVLSSENNWTYRWYADKEDTGKWTVTEQSVSSHYRVVIQENTGTFSIINSWQTNPPPPPTGDSASPLLWISLMCISGFFLLILGAYRWRRA